MGKRGAFVTEVKADPAWDFDYAPPVIGGGDGGEPDCDVIVATDDDVDPAVMAELLAGLVSGVSIVSLFSNHPLYWTRIEATQPIDRCELQSRLVAAGIEVRYVASARRGSQRLPPRLDFTKSRPCRARDWKAKTATSGPEPATPWRWFLGENGANVVRSVCGTGEGTRLAVIDNDGRELDKVDLDAEVLVGVDSVPRAGAHAGLLLGWAVGARTEEGNVFRGVAPSSSPRLYCLPKELDVFSLPAAIARAAQDGADVIVCATYVEGLTSPMLDDAIEFATRLGREGRGAALVFPTGRDMSSPPGSTHSSLSLALGDPASDPRVFCVGPSARDGGWFLWRDRKGELRPFANRGPAVRWLAPGDDMAYPFSSSDRPAHAESSGAAAIAAGVLLLVVAKNRELELGQIDALLRQTVSPVDPQRKSSDPGLADPKDLLPVGADGDAHNAKHGYGRLNAAAACMTASDPFALALLRIGEPGGGVRYLEARSNGRAPRLYSDSLACWAARTTLGDARLAHATATIARAIRLVCRRPERFVSQPPGHLVRHFGLLVRHLLLANPPPALLSELHALDERLRTLQEGDDRHADDVIRTTAARVLGWNDATPTRPVRKIEYAPATGATER